MLILADPITGVGVALMTSLAWSFSSICVKSATEKIDPLILNTLRTGVGAALLLCFVIFTDRGQALFSLPALSWIFIILSGFLAMVLGDTIYVYSLSVLDVSLAFPLSQVAFILLAVTAAVVLLGETFTWVTVSGAILVVLGIYLTTSSSRAEKKAGGKSHLHPRGILYLLIAVLAWTGATILLKTGVRGIDPFAAAALRISSSALILLFPAWWRGRGKSVSLRGVEKRYLGLAALAGVLTYGVAAVGYITALQWIGAGKTVLLTATAPLFAVPLAILILKERPGRRNLLGLGISLIGVWLVVI